MLQVLCCCAYLMQGQFLLWRNWGAATWKRYSKVPGAHHSNGLLKVLSTARGCGVKETALLWVWCWAVYRRKWQWYKITRFWLEGVADDCCDDGCFGLALDFCLFADSFEDSAMIPDLWGALLIREHCPAQSLDLLTSRACFFFFFDRHKMGHLLQWPIDNLWAQRLETKSLECPQGKLRASIN